MRMLSSLAVLSAVVAVLSGGARAGGYPSKPVMIIMPSPAGGGPDVIARIIADKLTRTWGQQVLVINRPGAGGLLGAQAAAAAQPDGYTLYMPISSTFVVLPVMQPKMPLDLAHDIVPIGLVGEQPMAIAVHKSVGVNTLAELVALARQRPGKILFGAGRGSVPHMTGEMLQQRLGIEFGFVPYPAHARAMQDTIAGIIAVTTESMSGFAAPMQTGAIKVLAVASAKRLPDFPDLPTFGEAVPDLKGFEARGWFALMAPKGTPEAIVSKVSADLRSVLAQDEVRRKFRAFGTYPRPTSPAETAEFIRREQQLWRPAADKAVAAAR